MQQLVQNYGDLRIFSLFRKLLVCTSPPLFSLNAGGGGAMDIVQSFLTLFTGRQPLSIQNPKRKLEKAAFTKNILLGPKASGE